MEASVKWVEDMTFVASSGSGHALVLDAAPDIGGHNLGPRPMELVLMGTGGCTAIDVVHILRKGRQPVSGCTVQLQAERAGQDPKVFTRIHFKFVVKGRRLKPEAVERAIKLSAEKYCSASIMLAKTAELTHEFQLVED